MRRDFGLTQALTLDDMRRGFIRALRDWSWSPSRLLWDEFPSIVLLMLIAVPILHRFRCEGYRRGLVTGFWLHVPWQVLVLLVVAFVTFRTERPAELPGASAQAYASFVGGLVMLGVLFAVRRFVTVQGVLFTLVLLSMILYALVDGARAQEAGATGAAKARHA
jgi:hypothetical protein